MRGLQYLRRKLRIKSRSFTAWLKKNCVSWERGEVPTMKKLIYSRSEGEKKKQPQNNEFYMYILNTGPCVYCPFLCSENGFCMSPAYLIFPIN